MCLCTDRWDNLYIFYIEEYKNKLNLHHWLKLSLNLKVYHICKYILYIHIYIVKASQASL